MSKTTIRVVTESKEFESLKELWDSLLQKCGDDSSMYLTHEWLSTWWKYFGDRNRKRLNVLLLEKEDQVIGIVPLVITEYRVGLIKLNVLESVSQTSCNYVGLILPENREEAMSAFLAYLERELTRNKVILMLSEIPEDSQFLSILRRGNTSFSKNLVIQEKVRTLAPYIALNTTWDEYFRSLGQKRRQTLRRALKSLGKERSVGFQQCTADSLQGALRKFFDLHQRRWQSANIGSQFSNQRMREFYRDIASQFLKKNWLHFSCLTVDNKIVSAIFSCIYNRKFYAITLARDIRYSKYSIGHLHYMFMIRYSIGKQLREFNFLRGDEPYKFYWTKSARKYMRVMIIKRGFWPSLHLKFLHAFLFLYKIRQHGLKESYYLYQMRQRERKELKRMGLRKSG